MSGYTLNGIAGRIRDLENKTNGAYYVGLCWLAMARNSGKGSRKLLEGKVFGQDKPASTFRNAWRIADKAFAEGFHPGHRATVAEMGLDEAIEFAVKALEDHKTALGVSNMKDYEEICKYADKATVPEAVPEPAAEDRTETVVDVISSGKASTEHAPLEDAIAAMMALAHHDLVVLAAKVSDRLADLASAQTFLKRAA